MRLYKFKSLSKWKHIEQILIEKKIYCPTRVELNDPAEGTYISIERFRAGDPIGFPLVTRTLETFDSHRILSLTRSFADPRMWAYYGDSFRGIAIELDFDGSDVTPHLVDYPETHIQFESYWKRKPPKTRVLTTKTFHWSFENEVRVLTTSEFLPNVRIVRILVGSRMTKRRFNRLRKIADAQGIPLQRTEFDPHRLEVVLDR